jgi:hypothetical protein
VKASRATVRPAPQVLGELERLAHQHGQSLAVFIRDHLETAITPTEPSPAPPDDAWEEWLTACLREVRVAIRHVVDGTGLPVACVLRSLVITACQPKTPLQLPLESADVERDSPVSLGAGPRSILR